MFTDTAKRYRCYARTRDPTEIPGAVIGFQDDRPSLRREIVKKLDESDVVIITSCCPDGREASGLAPGSRAGRKIFYDLDTPVGLKRMSAGEDIPCIAPNGLTDFDLVLSYTGGPALERTRRFFHSREGDSLRQDDRGRDRCDESFRSGTRENFESGP